MTELEKCNELKNRGYIYDPISGIIRNKKNKVSGHIIAKGYLGLVFMKKGKTFRTYSHRFAWYCEYGKPPVNQIDHINGDRTDNRIENLRDVPHKINHQNRTTAKGYTWSNQHGKWKASIKKDYKHIHLGLFDTEQEARDAYLEAKKIYHTI